MSERARHLEGGAESAAAISTVLQAAIDCLAQRQREGRKHGETWNGDGWYLDGRYYYARRQTTTPEYWNIFREPDGHCVDTVHGDGPAESMVHLLNAAHQAGREEALQEIDRLAESVIGQGVLVYNGYVVERRPLGFSRAGHPVFVPFTEALKAAADLRNLANNIKNNEGE